MYLWLSLPTLACMERSGCGCCSCAMVGERCDGKRVKKLDLNGGESRLVVTCRDQEDCWRRECSVSARSSRRKDGAVVTA